MKMIRQKGFTLIELLLYISLIAIFMTGAVSFAWDVIYGREKSYHQQIVEYSAKIAMSKIGNEIETAQEIGTLSPTSIELIRSSGSSTVISLNGDFLEININGTGTYKLTSNQVVVSEFAVTDISSSDNNSKNIGIMMTLEQSQTQIGGQQKASTTLISSFELNGQFNQSRKFVIDTTNMSLSGGTSLVGITLQNTSSTDVTIDKLVLDWSNTAGGENVTEVQIGGGSVEWSGTASTGETLELSDYTLTANTLIDIDHINFDSDMSDAVMNLFLIMSDASTSKLQAYLVAGIPTPTPTDGPTPTPTTGPSPTPTLEPTETPTPSPTPESETTCLTYCIGIGYSGGFCRANARQCEQSGEVYESGGNQYCTGGGGADTCCCFE